MDENKPPVSYDNLSPNPTEIPAEAANKAPNTKKSLSARVFRDLGVALGIVAILGFCSILYGLSNLTSGCKAAEMDAIAEQFTEKFNSVKVGGVSGNVVSNYNTDCIDGSGDVNVKATYSLTVRTVTQANDITRQALSPITKQGDLFVSGGGATYKFDKVETIMNAADGSNYVVSYNLQTPVQCQKDGKLANCDFPNAVATYDLQNRAIKSITLSLTAPRPGS